LDTVEVLTVNYAAWGSVVVLGAHGDREGNRKFLGSGEIMVARLKFKGQNRRGFRVKFRWSPTPSSVDDYRDVLLRGTICIKADGSLRQ